MSDGCPTPYPLYENLSHAQETALVVVAFVFIGGMTSRLLQFYDAMEGEASPPKWWKNLVKTWPLLGLFLYVPVGLNHFGEGAKGNMCIYPPPGTWGWWYLPGSAEFHVAWTGVVEVVGGASLALGGMMGQKYSWARPLRKAAASVLLILTTSVTFANCYMLTHGTNLFESDGPLPIWFHMIRFSVQAIWLSNLAYMASRDTLGGDRTDNKTD